APKHPPTGAPPHRSGAAPVRDARPRAPASARARATARQPRRGSGGGSLEPLRELLADRVQLRPCAQVNDHLADLRAPHQVADAGEPADAHRDDRAVPLRLLLERRLRAALGERLGPRADADVAEARAVRVVKQCEARDVVLGEPDPDLALVLPGL